jgi:hypothetical protein
MISNILGWWDLSCPASVTNVGFELHAVADISGGGNTMVKFGSTNWPVYSPTLFNSLPGVQITATDVCALGCSAPFPMGAGNTLTGWYVGTMAETGSGTFGRTLSYAAPGHVDFDNAASWCVSASASITTANFFRNSVGCVSNVGTIYPAGHTFIFTIDSGGIMTNYVDGIPAATSSSPGNWITGGTMCFGTEVTGVGPDYWRGAAGEWGVSGSYTVPANVAAFHSVLKSKWHL